VSYEVIANPGTLDLAAARILVGTAQGFVEQDVPVLQDVLVEQAAFCFVGQLPQSFVEAQAASKAAEVTRSRVFSVFMVLGICIWFYSGEGFTEIEPPSTTI
jgi:hypothetical protein